MSSQRRSFGITGSVSQPGYGIVCGRIEACEKFHRRCDLPEGAEQTISGGLQAVFVTRYQAKTCGLSASACGRLCGPVWLAKRWLQANPSRNVQKIRCKLCMFWRRGADPAPQHGALRRHPTVL